MDRRYTWRTDGAFFRVPLTRRYALACCDCGLVHVISVRLTKSRRVYLAAERDDRETASVRQRFKKTFSKQVSARPVAGR